MFFDPRTLPTTTSTPEFVILFLLVFAATFAWYGDYVTTVKGLAAGLTEGNPINRWLFSKIGQTWTAWLEMVAVYAVFLGLSTFHAKLDMVYIGSITVMEAIMYFRNTALLKKIGK